MYRLAALLITFVLAITTVAPVDAAAPRDELEGTLQTVISEVPGVDGSQREYAALELDNGRVVERRSGSDRYATAAALSAATYAPNVPAVYISTGTGFPDALAAGPAAAMRGGPVLLTEANRLPPATAAELTRLRPAHIIVAGGPSVVSSAVMTALRSYSESVTRQSGINRYATAAAISAATFAADVPVVYIATGRNFPDALAGGPAAGMLGGPVLLVEPNGIPSATAAELTRLRPARIVVAGGPAVIGDAVLSSLRSYSGSVVRQSGTDRYATAVAISAANHEAGSSDVVYIATAAGFPDALAASPIAGRQRGPVLLVSATSLPSSVAAELRRLDPNLVVIVGGPVSVSDNVVRAIMAILAAPTPAPATGEWGPPLSPLVGAATPDTLVPAKLQPITDAVFGTTITRIGDSGQRHAYSRIQPWSPSEKYLFLHYGGQWLLDGKTYAPIKQLSTPYVASWISDTTMIGTSGSRLVEYNVETEAQFTLHTFPQNVSMGEGEGAPSRDGRYVALQGGTTVYVYDRSINAVIAQAGLGAVPNNVTMSRLGSYVIVQFSINGTGISQGTHLYTRGLQHVRQILPGTNHMDPGVDAGGQEVLCYTGSGAVGLDVLATGEQRNLVHLQNVWAWVGHVSCAGPDGWGTWSPNSYHHPDQYGDIIGNDQTASFDMAKSEATTGKVWGHQHNMRVGYENSPMGVLSPSGTRVLFASDWGTSTYYPFIAER